MIITKCPLRISLTGGSTDLHEFIETYGKGSVISFPCNLYTYITLHKNNRQEYIINYTKTESFKDFATIENDIVRQVFNIFKEELQTLPTITVSFKSDIHSVGSGLAASSAYMIALIKAVSMYVGAIMSDSDICDLAIALERGFNPLTGYQDTFGCGITSFKRINFSLNSPPTYTFYNSMMLDMFDMYLLHTGISRSSTSVLKHVDVHKSVPLLTQVDAMHDAVMADSSDAFIKVLNDSWELKKKTSSKIVEDSRLVALENSIKESLDMEHDGYKLCGAGAGGYFLILKNKSNWVSGMFGRLLRNNNMTRINADQSGLTGITI